MLCDFCNQEMTLLETDLHDDRYLTEGSYSVYFCKVCCLGKTSPLQIKLDDLYENVYPIKQESGIKKLYKKILKSDYVSMFLLKNDRCDKFLNLIPYKDLSSLKILDVGCGVGDWMVALKRKGGSVSGVDLNSNAVSIATKRGLDARCIKAEDLIASEERFDIILLSQIVEHLATPVKTLKTLSKLLTTGGKLLIAVPNFDSRLRTQFKRDWINWYIPYHIYHHTQKSMTIALDLAGFQIDASVTYTPPSWWLNSIILKQANKQRGIKRVYPWWLPILYFPTRIYLSLAEIKHPHTGDCLCILASKKE